MFDRQSRPSNRTHWTWLACRWIIGTCAALAVSGQMALAAVNESGAAESTAVSPAAVDWIRRTATPVRSVQGGTGFEDLEPLAKLVGDARIVALGEPTHGSREAFQMKHRLLEYLVRERGFTLFSIEASMTESYRLEDYVLRGEGNPAALIGGMHFWTWNTEEVLAMVEWMREHNSKAEKPVHFTGFDMQFFDAPAQVVREYVMSVDPGYLAEVDQAWAKAKAVTQRQRPEFGVATATFPVELARGKRVRYSGWIRTQDVDGVAGLWWRVDGEKGVLAFDNMQTRGPKGTTPWTRYEIELAVPQEATNINFGVLMPGGGKAAFDELRIELDGVTYEDPETLDLDFESPSLTGFFHQKFGAYRGKPVQEEPHHGASCLQIVRLTSAALESGEAPTISAQEALESAQQVLEHMQAARPTYASKTSESAAEWAIQNARVVYQLMGSKAGELEPKSDSFQAFRTWLGSSEGTHGYAVRDASMAANVAWILEQDPNAKIVLWAHNGHVMRRAGAMGAFLEKRFPKEMLVVGFATGRGRYTAFGDSGLGQHDLQEPPAGSVERILAAAAIPNLVLDVRGAKPGDVASGWACEARPMRSIGARAMEEQFHPCMVRDLYDVLVYLDTTTPAVQLATPWR